MPIPSRFFKRFVCSTALAGAVVACTGQPELAVVDTTLTEISVLRDPTLAPGTAPLLQLPAYLRPTADGGLWTLDTGRKSAVRLPLAGLVPAFEGKQGHGPGEIWVALGIDVASEGTVWIADPGNAKITGFREGRVVSEFLVEHQPLGVVATSDGTVWVGGDLVRHVMVRYDRQGNRLGTAGRPLGEGARWFRLNQGVPARGSGRCAVVWAYTFHSVVECFAQDGRTLWQVQGPVDIKPARVADPYSMSADDRFAYVDVAASGGRVYALFVGGPASENGLRTREVHVFAASDGAFVGRMTLPSPAKHIARFDTMFAALDYDPEPLVRLYRVSEGVR